MTTTTNDPVKVFQRGLEATLTAVYPTRSTALDVAIDNTDYVGGITVFRKADGWGLQPDHAHDTDVCDLTYTPDGTALLDEIDFGMDEPDDWTAVNVMNANQWDELTPVKDFLNGRTDTVSVYTLSPAGFMDVDDDTDPYVDASNWTVLCANHATAPQWEDDLDNETANGVADMLYDHRDLTAWPARDGATIGTRDGHMLMTIRSTDGSCEIATPDGTIRSVLGVRDVVAKKLGGMTDEAM